MQKRQLGRNGLEVSVLGGVPPDVATSASKCRRGGRQFNC